MYLKQKKYAVNVLFSNDKLLVGVRLLRRTSNSIEARDDSNIMISLMEFRRARDEKYTGNVSFILNINSRCNSFQRKCDLEYKTREAVKECLSQLRKR
jgi:hypothetical protein